MTTTVLLALILVLFVGCVILYTMFRKKIKEISKRLDRLSLAYGDFEERVCHGMEVKCPICGEALFDTSNETYRHYDSLETDLMMNPRGKYFKCKNPSCPEYGQTKWLGKIEEESRVRQINYAKEREGK